MKFNRDGTLYQVETVIEAIEARCAKSEFPNLTDLLGSDWGWNASARFGAESYRKLAIETQGYVSELWSAAARRRITYKELTA